MYYTLQEQNEKMEVRTPKYYLKIRVAVFIALDTSPGPFNSMRKHFIIIAFLKISTMNCQTTKATLVVGVLVVLQSM